MKESEKMKELINQIIQDLGANKPIDGILLKTQVVAHKLKNEEFLQWVKNEQNGYEDMRTGSRLSKDRMYSQGFNINTF